MNTYGGRWIAEAEIGRGGMGIVYRARDRETGRAVALKVMRMGLGPDYDVRFEREARAAADVIHPNVVRLLDQGVEGDRSFLVFELVQGGSLADRVAKGPLPWREAALVGVGIGRALGAVHAQGRLHRDVKPSNVLFDGKTPKLADLGLVRSAHPSARSQGLTKTGDVIGTPEFLSPEQADGRWQLDGRTDLYGLGATLYFALSGKPPFEGTTMALFLAHMTRPPTAPGTLVADVPPALDALVIRLLAKDPEARGADAESVARELEAILGIRRRARSVPVLAALLLVLGVTAAFFLSPGGPAPVAAVEPSPSTPKLAPPSKRRHRGEVGALAVAPDGKLVASGGSDARVVVADLEGNVVKEHRTEGAVQSLDFSPDGGRIVCADEGEWVHLFDLRDGSWSEIVQHGHGATCALFRSGDEVVSGGQDGFVKLSAVPYAEKPRAWIKDARAGITALARVPDGTGVFYVTAAGEVAPWEFGKEALAMKFEAGAATRIAISEGGIVAVAFDGGRVSLVNVDFSAYRHRSPIRNAVNLTALAVSHGRLLWTTGKDAVLTPLPDGVGHATSFSHAVTSAAFAPDGRSYFVGLEDGTVLARVLTSH